jgi:hypothetical protein
VSEIWIPENGQNGTWAWHDNCMPNVSTLIATKIKGSTYKL